jgi:sugar diacid utilization regulator
MDDLAAALEDMAESIDAPAIATASESEVVAIIVLPEESTAMMRAIARFMLLTERDVDRINGVVGTSSVIATDGNDLVRSLVEARQVCRLNALRMPEPPGGASTPAQAPLSALLLRDDDNARATLHDAVLAPLVAYDSDRRSELIRTLDVFLSHNGSWHAAAVELAVHVNTIRYRLTRIEELTGRNLDSMADRVDFFVALRTSRPPLRSPPAQAPPESPPMSQDAERTIRGDQ